MLNSQNWNASVCWLYSRSKPGHRQRLLVAGRQQHQLFHPRIETEQLAELGVRLVAVDHLAQNAVGGFHDGREAATAGRGEQGGQEIEGHRQPPVVGLAVLHALPGAPAAGSSPCRLLTTCRYWRASCSSVGWPPSGTADCTGGLPEAAELRGVMVVLLRRPRGRMRNGRRGGRYRGRRASRARPRVTSSANSKSPPTGRPLASRVTVMPSGLMRRAR